MENTLNDPAPAIVGVQSQSNRERLKGGGHNRGAIHHPEPQGVSSGDECGDGPDQCRHHQGKCKGDGDGLAIAERSVMGGPISISKGHVDKND